MFNWKHGVALTSLVSLLVAIGVYLIMDGKSKSSSILTIKDFTPDPIIVNRAWHEEGTSWIEGHTVDKRFPEGGPDNTYLTTYFEPVAEKYLDKEWKITFKLPPESRKLIEERNKKILESLVTPTPSPSVSPTPTPIADPGAGKTVTVASPSR